MTILAVASADDVSMACIINKNPVQHWLYLDGGSKNNCCLPSRQDSNPHAYGFLKVTKIQNIFFIFVSHKCWPTKNVLLHWTFLLRYSKFSRNVNKSKFTKNFSGWSVCKRSLKMKIHALNFSNLLKPWSWKKLVFLTW